MSTKQANNYWKSLELEHNSDEEPDMSQHVCIYHDHCADGFGAAYAVWRMFGDDCTYVPASYGQAPPDVTGKDVYMVDFSYKRDVLLEIAKQARKVIILDHHDTAQKELFDLPSNVYAHFDQSKAGAVLTWEFLHGESSPYLLQVVQDRDLWQWKLPETKAVSAYLFSQTWTFEQWHEWVTATPIKQLREMGQALVDKQEKDVKALCDDAHIDTAVFNINGKEVKVPAVNCPWMFASDVGHELCNRFPDAPFSVTYMISKDKVKLSLRSNGKAHCGEIAAEYGGGGHPNAAGFSLKQETFARGMFNGQRHTQDDRAA